ncbi:MAG: hypothetical protein ACXU86_16955 [Archangium sp.]
MLIALVVCGGLYTLLGTIPEYASGPAMVKVSKAAASSPSSNRASSPRWTCGPDNRWRRDSRW